MRYHEASRQVLGLLLSVLFAAIAQPVPWALYLTTVIVVIGVVIRMWASGFIMKNKELATNGPYALVRHPLYVGKSVRVRSRLLSYFTAAPGEKASKLIREAVRLRWEYVPNEFAALVHLLVTHSYMNAETIRMDGGIRMTPK